MPFRRKSHELQRFPRSNRCSLLGLGGWEIKATVCLVLFPPAPHSSGAVFRMGAGEGNRGGSILGLPILHWRVRQWVGAPHLRLGTRGRAGLYQASPAPSTCWHKLMKALRFGAPSSEASWNLFYKKHFSSHILPSKKTKCMVFKCVLYESKYCRRNSCHTKGGENVLFLAREQNKRQWA